MNLRGAGFLFLGAVPRIFFSGHVIFLQRVTNSSTPAQAVKALACLNNSSVLQVVVYN
jgi:hypothetical protein